MALHPIPSIPSHEALPPHPNWRPPGGGVERLVEVMRVRRQVDEYCTSAVRSRWYQPMPLPRTCGDWNWRLLVSFALPASFL